MPSPQLTGAPRSYATWLDHSSAEHLLTGINPGAVRRASGIRQQTIADALGISRISVCAYELGTRRPTEAYARVILALARHLEVTW